MFKVHGKIEQERMTMCKGCEFYNKEHGTCGTPRWLNPLGQQVTWYRSKKRLCGCVMKVKAKLSWASCPLGKWKGAITEKEFKKFEKYVKSIETKNTFNRKELEELYSWVSTIEGKAVEVTVCGTCVKDAISEMRKVVRQYTEN